MQFWSKPRYYRFNDNLPTGSELKVRLRPDSDISVEVVAHLVENMVVEAWGMLNNMWL